jgi:NAD(P)-dependent dehydrogenase (short-subunit alcohol dehydrogenase family)
MEDLLKKNIKLAAMDVSNGESVVGAVKDILAATGRIDVLICNAGISIQPNVTSPSCSPHLRPIVLHIPQNRQALH